MDKISTPSLQVYFQSAYHGTPHRFDEFSLDNIGTGEGAQAHGWGLYFAENREVSEEYRERLSRAKVFYGGKEITDNTKYYYAKTVEIGKEEIISDLKDRINKSKEYLKFKDMDFTRAENKRLSKEYHRLTKIANKYYKIDKPTVAETEKF